ncbi:MAG TPA: hypothetical protein VGP72_09660 [Planctomycetota bacterium]
MITGLLRILAACTLIFALAGCGNGSRQDIMEKAKEAKNAKELRAALGKPDKIDSVEVLSVRNETWTYKGSDGEVVFQLMNDKVILKASGEKKK